MARGAFLVSKDDQSNILETIQSNIFETIQIKMNQKMMKNG